MKTPAQTLVSFPALLGYYHARLFGYVRQTASLYLNQGQLERTRLDKTRPGSRAR